MQPPCVRAQCPGDLSVLLDRHYGGGGGRRLLWQGHLCRALCLPASCWARGPALPEPCARLPSEGPETEGACPRREAQGLGGRCGPA